MNNRSLKFINKTKKKEVYDILTINTHERYQIQMAKTGHNFYAFMYDGAKEWIPGHGKQPDNYYILPKNALYSCIDFDFIISQSKFGQFQILSQINDQLRLPIISLEHTLPLNEWPNEQLEQFQNMTGDINVFISDYSANKWNINAPYEVIHHSIAECFKPSDITKEPKVLSVVHDFIKRDYCCNYSGWQRITKGLNTRVVGDTIGLSKQSESVEELVKEYQSAQVFLNTSTLSPIPMALLEAMACGCACVSTENCMIPEIIKHGVNGLISNDEKELRGYIEELLADEDLRLKLGKAARDTILTDFSEEKYINNWNSVFDKAYGALK